MFCAKLVTKIEVGPQIIGYCILNTFLKTGTHHFLGAYSETPVRNVVQDWYYSGIVSESHRDTKHRILILYQHALQSELWSKVVYG